MQRIRIEKRRGPFTLDVDLTFTQRVSGLFGPSGSGKTTILDCIAGLERPDRGAIHVGDRALFALAADGAVNVPVRRRHIGYVFQDGALFAHMSVAKNLRYGRHDGAGPNFDQVVSVLELGELLERRAGQLSGGEQRRVALGRALLSAPRLLLLDEPLTGLDRRLAGKTLAYIKRVLDTFDLPALYVSHSVSDIIYLCAEVAVLSCGRVRAQGCPRDLLAMMEAVGPEHPAAFKNIFTGTVRAVDSERGTLVCDVGREGVTVLAAAPADAVEATLMVPARDIILARVRPLQLSARNILPGRVTRIEAVGTHDVVFVNAGAEWMAEVTRQATHDLELAVGAEVYLVIKASSLHCVDVRAAGACPADPIHSSSVASPPR